MAEYITVPLDSITIDQELQVRDFMRKEKVEEYAQRIEDGAHFPPIHCGRLKGGDGTIYLVDGFHRFEAYKIAGVEQVECEVAEYDEWRVMYAYAFRANNSHGINMDEHEEESGLDKIIQLFPEKSIRDLKDLAGCSKYQVEKRIRQLSEIGQLNRPEKIIGKDGRERPAMSAAPTVQTDYILCPQCATPCYPENLEAPESTWVQDETGKWFCSPDCLKDFHEKQLSEAAEAMTGIPDELPNLPSAALPTHEEDELEPAKHETEPVLTEDEENRQIVEEIAELLKNFRPQRINNILILLFKSLNLNSSHITNIINARRYENSGLPEEEKTSFVWVLNDGSKWILPKSRLETFKTLYPAIDVEQELRNSIGWNLANQKNRKTKSGIEKHINTWLSNAQNRASCRNNQIGRKSGYVARDAGVDFENVDYNY